MLFLEIVFWLCVACVVYTYAGYPLLLALLARWRGRAVCATDPLPDSVSIVVAAHNEEKSVDRRLTELIGLLETSGLNGEVILVSDGSTDGTAPLARAHTKGRVRVIELPARRGKAAALNEGCALAEHDIIVFADIRQTWQPDALRLLLENFADPTVGAVSGDLLLRDAGGVLAGVALYWRYEKMLRRLEGRVWSVVGATGAISAVRRRLFGPIPPGTLLDDVYWPLRVALQGYRVIHDRRAVAYDRLPSKARDEFRRKVRTLSGNFQLLARLPAALVPWRNPIWLQFVSHKVFRLLVPWALLGALASSLQVPDFFYRTILIAQGFFYLLGLLGLCPAVAARSRLASAAGSFLVLNSAAWLAFWVWLSGKAERSWHKTVYQRPALIAPGKSEAIGRGVDRWLIPYLMQIPRRRLPRANEDVHLLLCIADHYEPRQYWPPAEVSRSRVRRWTEDYPRQFGRFRDSDGRTPRHTFFYPAEEYEAEYLDALADLCRQGFGEVEIHLHHDNDTAENLRRTLLDFKQVLHERHGLLSCHPHTDEPVYGFIHGNWALDNSRPDGRLCGVNNELDILRETGCYADFTLPSAPSPAQTRQINSIYYAVDDPCRPKSHDTGIAVGSAPMPERGLMLIQGPLLLDWARRKFGLLPRLENACIQGNQPACIGRLDNWLRARVQVPSRPDWFFVKLHTHGAAEENHDVLLGEPMVRFHEELARRAANNPRFHFHYVTAREMYNLAKAAESGWRGNLADALDFELASPFVAPVLQVSHQE
jgi:biofilm PGA synthesis N-glycosyltransferase PgaC